jgi:hypothetical protein
VEEFEVLGLNHRLTGSKLAVLAGFAIPVLLLIPWGTICHSAGSATYYPSGRATFGYSCGLFAFRVILGSYCYMLFFNYGLIACLRIRLAGGTPSVRQDLTFSVSNAGQILRWALLSTIVGTLLQALGRRTGWLGRVFAGLAGLAWSLATAFEAIHRSARAFRRTWGETVIANVGMDFALRMFMLPGVVILVLGVMTFTNLVDSHRMRSLVIMAVTALFFLAYWLVLSAFKTALESVFFTVCYQYATTGEVPAALTRQYIREAWRPEK